MRKVFAIVLAMLFLLCSCTNDNTASDNESGNITNSSDSTSLSVQGTQQPWLRAFYTEDFRYSSIDDFCEKVNNNGTDELFKYNVGLEGHQPDSYDGKRRKNISSVIDNCVYEMYYKGEKIDIHGLAGFNVHLGQEDKNGPGSPSYCEYFVEFTDDSYNESYVAQVRFYEMSRVKKFWDEFLLNPTRGLDRFTSIKLPYNSKEVNCVIFGQYDSEINRWLLRGPRLCFEYNEEVLIFIDFAPDDYAIYDVPRIWENDYLMNFFENFAFQKVIVRDAGDGSVVP